MEFGVEVADDAFLLIACELVGLGQEVLELDINWRYGEKCLAGFEARWWVGLLILEEFSFHFCCQFSPLALFEVEEASKLLELIIQETVEVEQVECEVILV